MQPTRLNEGDVFQAETPMIVDCDVLEAAKENIQPLASGRRVTALSAILATPHAHREAKLSATRNRLRINIEISLDDEDGDPLEAYCRLVYWTIENYPQGHSNESGLLELLEEATRVLKDDRNGLWRGEMKYLKLWLLYASFVEKPTVIYKFLIANEIGTGFSLLYEEYAAVLERDGRRKDADEAYVLGIARRALPQEHLQNRYSDFQKRMMCNTSPSLIPVPTESSRSQRSVLATSTRALPIASSSSSRPPSARGDVFSAPTPAHSTSNAPLQIFVDPSGSQSFEAVTNAWPDLGTRKTRIKENVPEVKKLGGTTLKQAGRSKRVASASGSANSGASSSKIVPYRDLNTADMPPPPVPVAKKKTEAVPKTPAKTQFVDGVEEPMGEDNLAMPKFTPFRDETAIFGSPTAAATSAPESIMKTKQAGTKALISSSEAEALRKDPLKNYGIELAADQ